MNTFPGNNCAKQLSFLFSTLCRKSWLTHCLSLLPDRTVLPQDGEIFDSYEDCLRRLNQYGIVAGCCFVTTKNRSNSKRGKSADFSCFFYSKYTSNDRGLEPAVVRDPGDTRSIISRRQRDRTTRTDHDCPVVYVCSFTQKRGLWIGRWRHQDHSDGYFPLTPMYFLRRDLHVIFVV